MTRARMPRPHEVEAAAADPRFLHAQSVRPNPSWRTQAGCRTVDPETFYPLPTEPADAALAVCSACPVKAECLRTALVAADCEGVWGATTPRERRAMLVAWTNARGESMPITTPALLAPSLRGSKRGTPRSPLHTPASTPADALASTR